jgi:Protein of unknown function (DUF3761)
MDVIRFPQQHVVGLNWPKSMKTTVHARLRLLVAFAFFLPLSAGFQALCQSPTPPQTAPSSSSHTKQPQETDNHCTDNGTYVNSKGETVKRPETCPSAPKGATAQCRDKTFSFSRTHQGTCSHHGGVAKWL